MRRLCRPALTSVELAVIAAIIAILAALFLSAVQAARESANRSQCQNNLRQLALAVHHFHEARGTLPTYCGIHPAVQNRVGAADNPRAVYGGWLAHLLPFAGADDLYRVIHEDIKTKGRNTPECRTVITPATGTWVPGTPGEEGRWEPPRRRVIDDPGVLEWVGVQRQNGYHTAVLQVVGQSWHWEPADSRWIEGTRGRPGYWDPPGSGPRKITVYEPAGIWLPEVRSHRFPQLLCPSDPSPASDPETTRGLVYQGGEDPPWGSINYLANWWALAGGDLKAGWTAPPQPLAAIRDGQSSTILFAEGYAWCDGIGRIALYPPNQHNFGLSQALPNTTNQVHIDGQTFTLGSFPHGYPNTWMFQVRPLPHSVAECRPGANCCNRWVAQTGHSALNVALVDGSVRSISARVSPDTWRRLLQPRDGEEVGGDW
jgi:type II secretory pathway pseudopilin PulG